MSKSIATYNSLVGLHRHVHQAGHHTADSVNLCRIDIGNNATFFVTLENHRDFFQGCITGTFTYTVHGDFHLTCTIQDTLHSIGGSHPQIIMTVGRNDSILDTVYMIHQIFDFRPIFVRQAITGRIRDIDNCRASFDDRFYHTCQIFVVSTSGIFAIKFDVFHISLGIFGSSDSPFQNIFLIRIELIPDMIIGRSNTCMNTSVLCIFQCFGSHINIFFYRTGKRTDCRPRYGFRYFNNAIEISRTRYGETGFYHVYSQFFQSFGYLNLFNTIQLATRHLFTVTQCRVENK